MYKLNSFKMYTQSCNYLPNKKQSFPGQLPHHLELIRNFTSPPIFKFEDSPKNMSVDLKTDVMGQSQGRPNLPPRTSIMEFWYSFKDPPSPERTMPSVATMPMSSSHLVGGFVGSKSQLGRRLTNGIGFKVWDFIVGYSPYFSSKKNMPTTDFSEEPCSDLWKTDEKDISEKRTCNDSVVKNNVRGNSKQSGLPFKQSYADVAKTKLPKSNETSSETIRTVDIECKLNNCIPENCSWQKCLIDPTTLCDTLTSNPIRNRITSECSADSEDSFIVFEYCEDDASSEDSCSSDDESVTDSQNCQESSSEFGSLPSRSNSYSKSTVCCKPQTKKVRFAEGKELEQIHPMVTWDYAYRSARRGPWEMLARDSDRFRCRIAKTEDILAPVLSPQHRAKVFQHRFLDLANSS